MALDGNGRPVDLDTNGRPYVYQWPNPDKNKPKVEDPPPKVVERPYRAGDEIYYGTMRLVRTAILGLLVITFLPGLVVFLVLAAIAYFGG